MESSRLHIEQPAEASMLDVKRHYTSCGGKVYKYCKKEDHTVDDCWKLHAKLVQEWKPPLRTSYTPWRLQPRLFPTGQSVAHQGSSAPPLGAAQLKAPTKEQITTLIGLLSRQCGQADSHQAGMADYVQPSSSSSWVIVVGATNHMTSNSNLLNSYTLFTIPKKVKIANGTSSKVIGTGSATIKDKIILEEVWHVPSLSFNMMSKEKLARDSNCTACSSST